MTTWEIRLVTSVTKSIVFGIVLFKGETLVLGNRRTKFTSALLLTTTGRQPLVVGCLSSSVTSSFSRLVTRLCSRLVALVLLVALALLALTSTL